MVVDLPADQEIYPLDLYCNKADHLLQDRTQMKAPCFHYRIFAIGKLTMSNNFIHLDIIESNN